LRPVRDVQDVADAHITSGMDVTVRGERWRVMATVPHADCTAIRLAGEGRTNPGARVTLLQPFDRVRDVSIRTRIEFVTRRRWWRTVRRHLACGQQPFGGLGVLTTAAIELLPYQLEPALAMLRHGRLRLLVADDVGLGKTIQAATVLAQLVADQPDLRALVVCPAGLRGQWRKEFEARFSLTATVCDVAWLMRTGRDLPPAVNPWGLPGIHIASIDLVKQPEVLRSLEAVTWDLAIFDEAHALSPGTARRAAAHALAGRSRRVVLLTATPPDGDPGHMLSLTALGQAPGGDDITVFRRTRADAGVGLRRRAVLLPVQPSLAERRMHRLLEDYTALLWSEARLRRDPRARLVTICLRKRALSSARSLALTLDRRLTLLGSNPPHEVQLLLPLSDEDPLDDAVDDTVVGAPGLNDVDRERQLIDDIREAAEVAARGESKVRRLARFLARTRESAIVFTEYRDTLTRLRTSLADREPLQLHGEMPVHERDQVLARFASEGGLLLATDAASEGLNLQSRCRLVVHFELPWNPMRLEQRVGRVDRLGQTQRVHEVLLVARHTAERLVLAPLVRRLVTAQRTRGGSQASRFTESDVAAMILDGSDPPPFDPAGGAAFRGLDLRSEARDEARRLGALRASCASGRHAPRTVVAHRRSPRMSRQVMVLGRVVGEPGGGPCLSATFLPLRIELEVPSDTADISARVAQALVSSSGASILSRVVHDHGHGLVDSWAGWRDVTDALARREREMRSVVACPSQQLVQAGLFDRRAQAAAEARQRMDDGVEQETRSRIEQLIARTNVQVRVEVVAIHFGDLVPE
jgi:superfamily II DNA or RNA helicase